MKMKMATGLLIASSSSWPAIQVACGRLIMVATGVPSSLHTGTDGAWDRVWVAVCCVRMRVMVDGYDLDQEESSFVPIME